MDRARVLPSPILVTGATGFVGRYVCAALANCEPAPTVVDVGGGTGSGRRIDLTDAAAVNDLIARERPPVLVHLAAQASVGAAVGGAAAQTFAVNLAGTLNLALAVARHTPEATVLFASSSEVYGAAFNAVPVDEEAVPRPTNAYARSKLMAEEVLAAVLPASARLVVARPFNHTGAGQTETFVLPSFAGQIARIEAALQDPVLRVGNLNARRDFLDVRDVVAAYLALLAAASKLPPRFTCNVGTGSARRLGDVLEAMRRLAHVPFAVEVDPVRLRQLDIPCAMGSVERLFGATGWTPRVTLDETLADLLDDARRRVSTMRRG